MRISDWSSDVCSSDLFVAAILQHVPGFQRARVEHAVEFAARVVLVAAGHARHRARPGQCRRERGRRQFPHRADGRSEEHTSELQSLMRLSYAVFCLTNNKVTTPVSNLETYHRTHPLILATNNT